MDSSSHKSGFFRASKAAFDVVAITASAGDPQALTEVLSSLPVDFPAAVLVVQHLSPQDSSLSPQIFASQTKLSVRWAYNGEPLKGGVILIALPNRHLLVDPDSHIKLTRTERVHLVRPSADPLFETVAAVYKDRSIAVVLTGRGRDGSKGVQAVKKNGGKVIAQDRETSRVFGMPSAAIKTGAVDFVLPLEEIGPHLVALVWTGDDLGR